MLIVAYLWVSRSLVPCLKPSAPFWNGWSLGSALSYLDDFLCVGPLASNICSALLGTLQYIADRYGVPLAPEKTEGPTTSIFFLCIILDLLRMECHLPTNKLEALKSEVCGIIRKRKIQLCQLQSLLAKLNFACCIIPMDIFFLPQAVHGDGWG